MPNISGPSALFWGVVTFSILVFIHEGGHYAAARFFGVKVHEFMIGLPGPALSFRSRKTGTRYGVTAFPLGGYVRIAGMEPGEEGEKLAPVLAFACAKDPVTPAAVASAVGVSRDLAAELLQTLVDYGAVTKEKDGTFAPVARAEAGETPDAFLERVRATTYRGLKTWKRLVVLSAGVVLNLLTAVVIFTATLSIWGVPTPSLTVEQVLAGSGAARAGVKAGDRLVSLDGRRLTDWSQVPVTVARHKPGQVVPLVLDRAGKTIALSVTLGTNPQAKTRALLGIQAALAPRRYPVLTAVKMSFEWIGLVFVAIGRFFNPSTFRSAVGNARSVVGVSYEVAAAARQGPLDYAWLVALLSLSLGAMNILPIPPLDGGKVAVEIVERIRRKPLSRELSLGLSAIGALLLFSLIFYLMYADIMRYIVRG